MSTPAERNAIRERLYRVALGLPWQITESGAAYRVHTCRLSREKAEQRYVHACNEAGAPVVPRRGIWSGKREYVAIDPSLLAKHPGRDWFNEGWP